LPSTFVGPDQAGSAPTDHLVVGTYITNLENEAKCAVYNYAPDIVTLEAGEDDIAYFQDVPNAPGRLDSLISTIQQVSPQTVILVASIAPSTVPSYQPLIEQYNSSVKSLVLSRKSAGQHIDFVDTGDLVTTSSNTDTRDGYSHENGPVEIEPSGFFKEASAFSLAIDNAVNAGWISDSLPLYKGPCNGGGGGTGGGGGGGDKRSIVDLRVMPIGDSITEGFKSTSGNSYRYELQQNIQNQGQKIEFVGDQIDGTMTNPENEGFTTKETAYIASQAVPAAASWRPNVAAILAGTNDVNGQDDLANAPGRLDSMISGLFNSAPDATMLVAGLPPSSDGTFNGNLQAFNKSVQSLVSNRQNSGQHVQYVDMSNLDPVADKSDPLHPNDAGYKIMGDNFANAIEDIMNKGWVTSPVASNRTIGSGGGARHGNGTPGAPPGPGKWQPQGEVANGGGSALSSFVQMADINGDGRPDYLVIDPNGSVTAYFNAGPNPAGGWVWLLQPLLTRGFGRPGSQIRFADINGDGRADYLAIDDSGAVSGYLNGDPNPNGIDWIWLPQPPIANGVGGRAARFSSRTSTGTARPTT